MPQGPYDVIDGGDYPSFDTVPDHELEDTADDETEADEDDDRVAPAEDFL